MKGLVNMRLCSDCKFDVDIEVPNECEFGKHKWHDPLNDSWDMCCDCGKDVDYLLK